MDLNYSAEHVLRFTIDEPIRHRDRDIDYIRVEIMWCDESDEGPEGWWITGRFQGWPLTAKGARDKRVKTRESVWASVYPNDLWTYVSDAWTIALDRTGINATKILNPARDVFDPANYVPTIKEIR
jgi:hypothetical protein